MSDSDLCYRKLRGYKYQSMEDYTIKIDVKPPREVETRFIDLTKEGELTVKKHYAWDGPSGPTFDTANFMRGSLVHDALYQLMRDKYIDQKHRKYADMLLREHCREDGMGSVRAWYVYWAVRLFAAGAAKPASEPRDDLICLPLTAH